MSTEQNKAIVLQFYRFFDDRQIDRATNLLAPNFIAHLAGVAKPLNAEAFEQFGMTFYLAFTQGQHQFEEVLVDDDRVVTCGRFTAIHSGEFQGLPPTGKRIQLAVMHIDRLENGKIVEHWGQGDALGLMQQLGILFLPGPRLLPPIIKGFAAKLFNRSRQK